MLAHVLSLRAASRRETPYPASSHAWITHAPAWQCICVFHTHAHRWNIYLLTSNQVSKLASLPADLLAGFLVSCLICFCLCAFAWSGCARGCPWLLLLKWSSQNLSLSFRNVMFWTVSQTLWNSFICLCLFFLSVCLLVLALIVFVCVCLFWFVLFVLVLFCVLSCVLVLALHVGGLSSLFLLACSCLCSLCLLVHLAWVCTFGCACIICAFFYKYALRVLPAETRLTVYRRLRVGFPAELSRCCFLRSPSQESVASIPPYFRVQRCCKG